MALIAPNTFRSTVSGTYAGGTFANVIDWRPVLVSGSLPPRSEMPDQMNFSNLAIFLQTAIQRFSNLMAYDTHTWVDLDSENGSTGTSSLGSGVDGGEAGASFPANVAARAVKSAIGGRGDRRGSLFFVGVLENETPGSNPNQWGPAAHAGWQGNLTQAFGEFEAEIVDGPNTWYPQMVVTRTRTDASGEVTYNGTSAVNGLDAQLRLATQRRRLSRA